MALQHVQGKFIFYYLLESIGVMLLSLNASTADVCVVLPLSQAKRYRVAAAGWALFGTVFLFTFMA